MKTVLIVDDEAELGKMFGEIVKIAGHKAIVLERAESAVALIGTIDALMTDFMMPGMSGVELAREAKRQRPDLPVVIATACPRDLPDDHLADKVMAKPVMMKDILEWLENVLG